MRVATLLLMMVMAVSCKKYQDPPPYADPRLTNPYCNIPAALNYNWGFPGVPDNSICIYPSTVFSGSYFYRDSLYNEAGEVISTDSFPITITVVDTSKVNIVGFCGTNVLKASADKYYKLRLDSTFLQGQHLCDLTDTITGLGSKKGFEDTATIKFTYQLNESSGISYHSGTAVKQ
ncbi:MAG: hypothetical protein JNM95_09495 [Chitinophagaceae bacterium]|nr:hypothetical protein [Chitinophagaceae bacterium]